jgi:hypothetical protein
VCEATDASTGIHYAYPSPSDWGRDEAQTSRERTADESLADLLESRVQAHGAGVDAALPMAIQTAIARLRRPR